MNEEIILRPEDVEFMGIELDIFRAITQHITLARLASNVNISLFLSA